MESANNQGLMNLPGDWWRSLEACEKLARWFRGHLLGLWIRFGNQSGIEPEFYTGFLLDYKGVLLWITAGHIIDRIKEILSNQSVEISGIRWVDQCSAPGADSIPIGRTLCCYSATEIGIDFGAIKIQGLEADNIRACDETTPLTEEVWIGLDRAHPEGFYMLGYPKEGFEVTEGVDPSGQVWGVVEANLAFLPVERIEGEDRHQLVGETRWWDRPSSFYGRICSYTDPEVGQPQDINWMSGAPVFSVEREPEGIRYRLVGIQSSWVKSARQIRAEPIHSVVPLLDDFLLQEE
jgi:hypothetical protein